MQYIRHRGWHFAASSRVSVDFTTSVFFAVKTTVTSGSEDSHTNFTKYLAPALESPNAACTRPARQWQRRRDPHQCKPYASRNRRIFLHCVRFSPTGQRKTIFSEAGSVERLT